MDDLFDLAWLGIGLTMMLSLMTLAERLCEMEPRVIVQVVPVTEPTPESAGDRAATGSE